jgi:hypothetical protein
MNRKVNFIQEKCEIFRIYGSEKGAFLKLRKN